jgi:hypothetical protein
MKHLRRISLTAAVATIGGLAGAAAGAAVATIVLGSYAHRSLQLASELYALGTQTGATLGIILGPHTAFTATSLLGLGAAAARLRTRAALSLPHLPSLPADTRGA